jgi:hypothetical protein
VAERKLTILRIEEKIEEREAETNQSWHCGWVTQYGDHEVLGLRFDDSIQYYPDRKEGKRFVIYRHVDWGEEVMLHLIRRGYVKDYDEAAYSAPTATGKALVNIIEETVRKKYQTPRAPIPTPRTRRKKPTGTDAA